MRGDALQVYYYRLRAKSTKISVQQIQAIIWENFCDRDCFYMDLIQYDIMNYYFNKDGVDRFGCSCFSKLNSN